MRRIWKEISRQLFEHDTQNGYGQQTAGGELLGGGTYAEYGMPGARTGLYRREDRPDGSTTYYEDDEPIDESFYRLR